ncbi:hypothetical protein E2C01_064443 [Portunus trituberculatus]|uniref:Uncharacterized protein n=1 Tax=Portunus trituberculatus TaxID=210409 RepID=A0A5B7HBV3_PORTR|nr:hypothetical protein [Portunus trituberculatus]
MGPLASHYVALGDQKNKCCVVSPLRKAFPAHRLPQQHRHSTRVTAVPHLRVMELKYMHIGLANSHPITISSGLSRAEGRG